VKRRCVLRNISVCRQEGRQAGKRRILINGPPCKGMDKNGPPCKGQPVVLKMVPRARDGPPYTEWSPVQIKMVPRANWSSVPIKVVLVLRARDTHPGRYKLLNMVPGADDGPPCRRWSSVQMVPVQATPATPGYAYANITIPGLHPRWHPRSRSAVCDVPNTLFGHI